MKSLSIFGFSLVLLFSACKSTSTASSSAVKQFDNSSQQTVSDENESNVQGQENGSSTKGSPNPTGISTLDRSKPISVPMKKTPSSGN